MAASVAVSAALVKELRERTGAGMVDCKNALVQSDGDVGRAIEFLREKGLAAAAKKAGRIASEGLVLSLISEDGDVGSIVEVNSETDFVAKNEEFRGFVEGVASLAQSHPEDSVEDFLTREWPDGGSVKDALIGKIAIIGENLTIRRKDVFNKQNERCALVSYVHGGGRVAVMMELGVAEGYASCCGSNGGACGCALGEVGKNIAMQIAAMSPRFISRDEISQDFIDKEREILKQQALEENKDKPKPESVLEKMVEGRLNKLLKDYCLLEQEYVKDSDLTVAAYLETQREYAGGSVSIMRFVRYETGEGIEKKEENFAEEVSKAMQV